MIRKALITGLLLLSARCFAPEARLPPERIRSEQTSVQGTARKSLLYVPTDIERSTPRLYPLVLVFHERDGGPQSIVRLSRNRFQELAEVRRFFIAFPVALNGRWRNADVLFVRLLLDELIRNYPIDPKQIYAAGFDEGAFFTLQLVCEASDRIRAAAVISGGLRRDQICPFTQPVSVLIAHGTADPIVPYDGGEIQVLRESLGHALPFQETARRLRMGLGCADSPDTVIHTNRLPDDHTSITTERYDRCQSRRRLHVVTIHGGGHTWPDGWSSVPPEIVGPLSKEWNAADRSIEFFFTGNEEPL